MAATGTAWHSDRWFVSPWNYLDEAMRGASLPKRVKFHDVCLRDGEQQAGVEFTPSEKVRLATMLAEAPIQSAGIGTATLRLSPDETQATLRFSSTNLSSPITGHGSNAMRSSSVIPPICTEPYSGKRKAKNGSNQSGGK